jgi:hypothetical protein
VENGSTAGADAQNPGAWFHCRGAGRLISDPVGGALSWMRQTHTEMDSRVRHCRGQDARAVAGVQVLAGLMRERGLMCEVEVHSEIGHVYPPEFVQSLDRAFDFLIQD